MFEKYTPKRPLSFSSLCLALVLFASTPAHSLTKIILFHPGGPVNAVFKEVDYAIKHDARVRILGECISACTMYLKSEELCITKEASFKFHQAQLEAGPRHLARPDPDSTRRLMEHYPPRLRNWIKNQGGLPWEGFLTLNASMAVNYGIVEYCRR